MTTDPVARWLVTQIDEDLDAMGVVGLYEFIWTLRGRDRDGAIGEFKRIARDALAEIRAGRRTEFVRQRWATSEQTPLPTDYIVRDEDFDDIPEDGWYVAITSA